VEQNLLFYLPQSLRRVIVVHNITPMTYRAAGALRDQVDAAICVSLRIRHDLIASHGFAPERTICIPNGIVAGACEAPEERTAWPFRVLFAGRIEEHAKGLKYLTPILAVLRTAIPDATLTIAGDGPDLESLQQAVAVEGLSGAVTFLGSVPRSEVARLACQHHAVVLTSRFEGCPMSLLECMAAGCVPVASRISGVTDTIVRHGENGFLFPVGDVRSAAARLTELADSRELRERLSERAASTVRESFSAEAQAEQYPRRFSTGGCFARANFPPDRPMARPSGAATGLVVPPFRIP